MAHSPLRSSSIAFIVVVVRYLYLQDKLKGGEYSISMFIYRSESLIFSAFLQSALSIYVSTARLKF